MVMMVPGSAITEPDDACATYIPPSFLPNSRTTLAIIMMMLFGDDAHTGTHSWCANARHSEVGFTRRNGKPALASI
ncbi:hypothetical protein E2C01_027392 [Portunus trituberculatus]|uniref:Uncharacterized protein n=1 Tax=Portunus trituberculatus TaxID=210409 RepID=A0A5B7EHS6_PORTR|nr:hypothetical protein [Portunus trituberculatus]